MTDEQRIWLDAWNSRCSASNCVDFSSPKRWADKCLKEFKETFSECKEERKVLNEDNQTRKET